MVCVCVCVCVCACVCACVCVCCLFICFAIQKMDALTHINLQANKLTSVVDLHSLPGLENLVLSSNQIQNATFPAGYTMLTNLSAVDLSYNNISQLTNDTFAMLSKSRVLELDLSGNIIK